MLYDMIHPEADDTFTVRAVFIIDPEKKIRLEDDISCFYGKKF